MQLWLTTIEKLPITLKLRETRSRMIDCVMFALILRLQN